jgi:hypothetical protein
MATDSHAYVSEAGVKLSEARAGSVTRHQQILAICWIVYGIWRLLLGLFLIAISATATLMFGALLTRVPDPFSLMADFHIFYTFAVILSFVCGVLGVISGLVLMGNYRRGRLLAIATAVLSVSEIPLGTVLGVFTLVLLIPAENDPASIRRQPALT